MCSGGLRGGCSFSRFGSCGIPSDPGEASVAVPRPASRSSLLTRADPLGGPRRRWGGWAEVGGWGKGVGSVPLKPSISQPRGIAVRDDEMRRFLGFRTRDGTTDPRCGSCPTESGSVGVATPTHATPTIPLALRDRRPCGSQPRVDARGPLEAHHRASGLSV